MTITETTINSIEETIRRISTYKKLATKIGCNSDIIDNCDKLLIIINKYKDIIPNVNLAENYLNQFQASMAQVQSLIQFGVPHEQIDKLPEPQIIRIKASLGLKRGQLVAIIQALDFTFTFFEKLGFLGNNIVAIGANGSGKSTLSVELKKYLPQNGVVISAQRILLIPTFSAILNIDKTSQSLKSVQLADKSSKNTYTADINGGGSYNILNHSGNEFSFLLANLIAERNTMINRYWNKLRNNQNVGVLPVSNLDKAMKLWNSLISHRSLNCENGVNLLVEDKESNAYAAHLMSDGEKVMLYLIAQVLQAPKSGFIIVDEPEMYLHKTILKKLWDVLEEERKDCIFIYLTHDLDFAESRYDSKKIWVKSFTYPNTWSIESIPDNNIPRTLLFEILGSRRDILFCEGQKNSIDSILYNILFPNLTVVPVGGCVDVINYTKAFNKIPNSIITAYGLIDSDYHCEERLRSLIPDNIYSYSMAEVENFFLDEELLFVLFKKLHFEDINIVNNIKKDVIKMFSDEVEMQVANYISGKINYYFNGSHVVKGNDCASVTNNFHNFIKNIKITEWFEERRKYVEDLITCKEYSKILSIFNHKGIKVIAQKYLKNENHTDFSLRFLKAEEEARVTLLKYFPAFFVSERNDNMQNLKQNL